MSFHPTFKFLTASLLAAVITMQPMICRALLAAALQRSVAVQPLLDGDADADSRDIAAAVSSALRMTSDHHIIDTAAAAKVIGYQSPAAPASSSIASAKAALSRAKEHYFNFRYKDSESELSGAISILLQARAELESGQVLVDAYVTRALLAKTTGDRGQALKSLEQALDVDPALSLFEEQYPPSFISLLEEVRKTRAGAPAGALMVKSRPPAAEVFINGISRGLTPIEISDLPTGSYSLVLKANRYAQKERIVAIAAGETLSVDEKLKWDKGDKGHVANAKGQDASSELREGLRSADALKVDQVILIDADNSGDALQVRARTVDRSLRAGQRAVAIKKLVPDTRNEQLAEMVAALADQIDADLLSDPSKKLDPLGEGDPVLLGKQKKPLTRRPLFWVAVGTVTAGAVIGGILAAMAGGPSTGSLKVEFR